MKIKVNGEDQPVDAARISIAEILVLNQVTSPETISVQKNGEFVDPQAFATTFLESGDEVDFLYFLGGGSIR